MRGLSSIISWGLLGGGLMLGIVACHTMKSSERSEAVDVPPTVVGRGHYMIMNVASCASCHRMTLPASEPAPGRRGSRRPDLGRLGEDQRDRLIGILESGKSPLGMPVFHMSQEDAEAAWAFLRSLSVAAEAAPARGSN